jgi:hypothetical protein
MVSKVRSSKRGKNTSRGSYLCLDSVKVRDIATEKGEGI